MIKIILALALLAALAAAIGANRKSCPLPSRSPAPDAKAEGARR